MVNALNHLTECALVNYANNLISVP
jgi:hypothetical protein